MNKRPAQDRVNCTGQGNKEALIVLVKKIVHQIHGHLTGRLPGQHGDIRRSEGVIHAIHRRASQGQRKHRIHTGNSVQLDLQEMCPIPLPSKALGQDKAGRGHGVVVRNRQSMLSRNPRGTVQDVDDINDQIFNVLIALVFKNTEVKATRRNSSGNRKGGGKRTEVLPFNGRAADHNVRADDLPGGSRKYVLHNLDSASFPRCTAAKDKGQARSRIVIYQGAGVGRDPAHNGVHRRTDQSNNRLVGLI